jgi:uncharacterized protein YndB with AHSA1/START domain/DNA-binding transcriptional ArsR family regulator
VDDPVFGALADPTRRHLLDLLFERDGLSLGELVAAVPGMTRFGVMKHLRVLAAAELVTTRRVGREKHHYLNPVPIRRLHDRWLDKYRARAADSLLDLKRAVERAPQGREGQVGAPAPRAPDHQEGNPMTSTVAPAFVSAIYIRATPEAIWRAITETDYTLRYFYGSAVECAWTPGSAYRMTIDGELQIEGRIVEVAPPRRLVQSWHGVWDEGMAADAPTTVTWEIEEAMPGVCKVSVIHEGLVAGSATLEQVSGGWPFILSGMKSLLETGKGLGEG